jgi:hypothetical protein
VNANREDVFEAATRHLFGHLRDASALRQNPLVRSYFIDSDGTRIKGDLTLALLRSQLRALGQRFHSEDLAAGRTWQADRWLAILSGLCEQKSSKEIASEVGVSLPQFYRDRRFVCLRAARAISEQQISANIELITYNPLRFQLRRLNTLVDQGFSAKAIALGEYILSGLHSDDRISTLLHISNAMLEFGDLEQAEARWRLAKRLLESACHEPEQLPALQANLRLTEYRIAREVGRSRDAKSIITSLGTECNGLEQRFPEYTDLAVTILLEQCRMSVVNGLFTEAQAVMIRADKIARRYPTMPSEIQWQLPFMKAYSSENGSFSSDERFELFSAALHLGLTVGSAKGALFAIIGLVHHCANLGFDDQAQAHGEAALTLARSMEGSQYRLFVVDSVAPILLRTKNWSFVRRLIIDVASLPQPRPNSLRLALFRGQLLARAGRFEDAVIALTSIANAAHQSQSQSFMAALLPELALALNACGRDGEAKARVQMAICLAESCATPSLLRFTYDAAAKVLGDPKMRLRAQQLETRLRALSRPSKRESARSADGSDLVAPKLGFSH